MKRFYKIWISIACLVVILVVLAWPVGTWLQCRELQVDGEGVDAVYFVAGSSHQDVRMEALTHYVSTIADVDNIKFLVGRDLLNGPWSREKQKNLTRSEWAVVKIRDICAGKGELSVEVLPGSFTGTDGEMEALAVYLKDKKAIQHIALVSSSFHLRRLVGRLDVYSDGGVAVNVVAAGSWDDRMPWTVLLELGKMTRDMIGLSRAPLMSRR